MDAARRALCSALERTGLFLAQILLLIVSALQWSFVNPAAFLSCSFQSFVKVVVWGFFHFAVLLLQCVHGCIANTTVNAPKN